MKGLSKKEIEVVSDIEFRKIYYFSIDDIKSHFKDKKQLSNTIYTLRKKGRIVSLNRHKYFLVPIKARKGKWTDNAAIIADEMFDGKDYYINGWHAAHYWRLTDQMPMQVDIYTTRRQGKSNIMGIRFVFHRTTKMKIGKSSVEKIGEHPFRIADYEETKKWIRSRR